MNAVYYFAVIIGIASAELPTQAGPIAGDRQLFSQKSIPHDETRLSLVENHPNHRFATNTVYGRPENGFGASTRCWNLTPSRNRDAWDCRFADESVLDSNEWSCDVSSDIQKLVRVKFESTPAGAVVTIDDKMHGATTLSLFLSVEGKYNIKLKKDGYKSWEKNGYVPPKAGEIIKVVLEAE